MQELESTDELDDAKKDHHDFSISHHIFIKKYKSNICITEILGLSQFCLSTTEKRLRSQSNTCART